MEWRRMKNHQWLLYDSGAIHPFLNMAMDEVLLTQWEGRPVLVRFYAWSPPGLSLGYFQKYEEMERSPVLEECGAVITRRITGGDAILHINELTFSITGLEGQIPFQGSVESSYHRIHNALAKGFERFGLISSVRGPSKESHEKLAEDANGRCFYRVTGYDLVAQEKKLVGSAQRRTQGMVLHHGSIPISPNPMTPKSADLSTLSQQKLSYRQVADAVRTGLEASFNIGFKTWRPDQGFLEASKKLAEEKYGAKVWVQRK